MELHHCLRSSVVAQRQAKRLYRTRSDIRLRLWYVAHNSSLIYCVLRGSTRSHAALMIKRSTLARLLQSCGPAIILLQGAQAVITDIFCL